MDTSKGYVDELIFLTQKNIPVIKNLLPYIFEENLLHQLEQKDKEISELRSQLINLQNKLYENHHLKKEPETRDPDLIKKNQSQYKQLIENTLLGFVEVDAAANIVDVNNNFCKISGFFSEELIGKQPFGLFLAPESKINYEEKINERKQGKADSYQSKIFTKSGDYKWCFISGAPIFDHNNNFCGSVAIVIDITSQKELELHLIQAKNEAEQRSKAKDAFMANLSHEIRTPMNAIMGMTRQLQKTKLTAQQQIYADSVKNATSNLTVLLNDILDLSKIEAGMLHLDKKGFRLKDVIHDVTNMCINQAEQKGIEIFSAVDKNIHDILLGDAHRVYQVLMNLTWNALKFTEKGNIRISCSLIKDESSSQNILIKVSDTGIGMTEDFLKNLFTKFSQEYNNSHNYGGTGLGMSIIKELITIMNGNITVTSEKNIGTSVSIIIDFDKGSDEDIKKKEIATIKKSLHGAKILLAEDNEMNRMIAVSSLEEYGAVVDEAYNGIEAINKLKFNTYDLVLMDIRMPVMDGFTATEFIRKEISADIPIIALTSNVVKKEVQKCFDTGMNDFLAKPFEEDELHEIITKWYNRGAAIKNNREINELQYRTFNLSKLKKVVKDNKEFQDKMLTIFIAECKKSMSELTNASINADYKTVSEVSHRIKPLIINMGVDSIVQEILELENLGSGEELISKSILCAFISKINLVLKDVIEEIYECGLLNTSKLNA